MANEKKEIDTGNSHLGFEAQLWAAADKMRGHVDLTNPPFNMSDWSGENPRQDVRNT